MRIRGKALLAVGIFIAGITFGVCLMSRQDSRQSVSIVEAASVPVSMIVAESTFAAPSPVKALDEREVYYPGTEDLGPERPDCGCSNSHSATGNPGW